MYKIKLIAQGQKDLDKLPQPFFLKIKTVLEHLSSNPRPHGCLKLTGEEGFRVRIGDYRVLYRINDETKEIFIYRIKHRKDAYR